MLATFKRVRAISQRAQLIATTAVLVLLLLLLLLLSALVLSVRLQAGTSVSSPGGATSAQSSTGPDLRDEHPQRQWQAMHQHTPSPSGCVPVATNGRGYVPATGAGSC